MSTKLTQSIKWLAPMLMAMQVSTAYAADPVSVEASTDDGNGPNNTLDNDLATRWSANGSGQWIRYNLGTSYNIESLDIAFYKGDQRNASFDVLTSEDGQNWNTVFSGTQPSSTTDQQTISLSDSIRANSWLRQLI